MKLEGERRVSRTRARMAGCSRTLRRRMSGKPSMVVLSQAGEFLKRGPGGFFIAAVGLIGDCLAGEVGEQAVDQTFHRCFFGHQVDAEAQIPSGVGGDGADAGDEAGV